MSESNSQHSAHPQKKYQGFEFEKVFKNGLNSYTNIKEAAFKNIRPEDKFTFLVDHLNYLANSKQLSKSVDTINDIIMSNDKPSVNQLISLIFVLETIDYLRGLSDGSIEQIPNETRLALECYILNNREAQLSSNPNAVQKAFLLSVGPKPEIHNLTVQDLYQSLETVTETNSPNEHDKFIVLTLITRILLRNQVDLPEDTQTDIELIISQNLPILNQDQLIKYLECSNFTKLSVNSFWLYAIEQKIADELLAGLSLSNLTRLINYLAEYNSVFRQKLIFLLNEKAKPHIDKLPLSSLLGLVYVNYVNQIEDPVIQTIDLSSQAEVYTRPFTATDIIRFKTLDVFGSEFVKKPKNRINSLFQRLVQDNTDDQVSLKAYMLSYHSANEEAMKIIRKRLEGKHTIDINVLAPLIIELGFMYENGLIRLQAIKDNFEWLFQSAKQQLNQLDEQTAYVVSEALAQMTDKFDGI